MSEEHKASLAHIRRETKAIKNYLTALESTKLGRPVTRESLASRLASIEAKLDGEVDALRKLELIQQRLETHKALTAVDKETSIEKLEETFIDHARSFSTRKGISYTAWRDFGVPAAILRKAGIPETRRR